MKKFLFFILFVAFLATSFKVAEALTISTQFAGNIYKLKAKELEFWENTGFECIIPGQSIEIRPRGKRSLQPTSYLIPYGVVSRTKNPVKINQQIIGRYSGKTSITCVNEANPQVQQTVLLDTITLFGNSAK